MGNPKNLLLLWRIRDTPRQSVIQARFPEVLSFLSHLNKKPLREIPRIHEAEFEQTSRLLNGCGES
jgi:hypothetical protein